MRGLRTCLHCGVAFAGTVRAHYCSPACRWRAYYQRHAERERARWRAYYQRHSAEERARARQ
jgi:hypothetical protein